MLNILMGAAVGAAISVASYLILQTIQGQPWTWDGVASSAIGGAVGGALAGATCGISLIADAGATSAEAWGAQVGFNALNGAVSSAAGTAADDAMTGAPLDQGVADSAAYGALFGAAFYAADKGLTQVFPGLDLTGNGPKPIARATAELEKDAERDLTETVHDADRWLGIRAHARVRHLGVYVTASQVHAIHQLGAATSNAIGGWLGFEGLPGSVANGFIPTPPIPWPTDVASVTSGLCGALGGCPPR